MLRSDLWLCVALLVSACDSSDKTPTSDPGSNTSEMPLSETASASMSAEPEPGVGTAASATASSEFPDVSPSATDAGGPATLCAKYGGKANVAAVVHNFVFPAIAQDCRINAFFAALTEEGQVRVKECLSIQVQELFSCEGVAYQGSHAANGLPCRSMAKAHIGLQINKGDFDALIEDVVAGMSEAGVEASDIGLAAPALLGMQPDIVERTESTPSLQECQ